MNGGTTVGASDDPCIQHRQSQNETNSDHPQSPNSPLSIRHGKLKIIIKFGTFVFQTNFKSPLIWNVSFLNILFFKSITDIFLCVIL